VIVSNRTRRHDVNTNQLFRWRCDWRDVLARLATHPAKRIDQLLAWAWATERLKRALPLVAGSPFVR